MDDYALVLNAGSSSLKFCVFGKPAGEGWRQASRGQIEGIGTSPRISARNGDRQVLINQDLDAGILDQRSALDALAHWLRSTYAGARILGVGHRVVHGGVQYAAPTVVTRQVLADLHTLEPLAPLHQPHNLAAIEAVFERLPDVPQVACFDTSFHRTQSPLAQLIALPRTIRDGGVQRYGFHGLSYEYISTMLPQMAPEIAQERVIVAHLGSGSSLCAIKNGKSVDSSLGFTALDGLCMGTRPGSVDPGVILYLFENLKLTPEEVAAILYKKSGLLGISGISNDMRVLLNSNEPDARVAVDFFVYRAAKEIGALAAILGGVDGLVFTAGIGENSVEIRKRICQSSAWLGIELDQEANLKGGPRLSEPGSKVSAWVIPTNEELMIAWHTGVLLGLVAAHA
jgi:acetate kinase